MPDSGDWSGLRDRLTKLEFQVEQRPTKDFVSDAADRMLTKASSNDKERNDNLLKLIDERLGAHRSAILTDMERDHQKFRTEVMDALQSVLMEKLPHAVRAEVDKIEDAKAAEAERAQAEREAKIQRYRNRVAFVGSCVVLLTAMVTFWFSLSGETSPTQIRHLDSVGDAITDF